MCGFLVWLYSLSMLPPMVVALFYKEKSLFVFFITFVIFFCIGGGAWYTTKKSGIQLRTRDGFIIIVMFWILFSVISAFPLWIDSELNLTFIDALFEGVSGITTTGATVIDDVSSLPRAYLYYRSQLNFIGGLGVIGFWRLLYCHYWVLVVQSFISQKCRGHLRMTNSLPAWPIRHGHCG
ncbi:Rac prophage potassium transporter subunit [Escherichia coli]|nr:Rac prophage potassium transporter subunit [Escherichia coli]